MLLHHYISATHGPDALKDSRLFASRVSSFNDPLELTFQLVGQISVDQARQQIISRRDSVTELAPFLSYLYDGLADKSPKPDSHESALKILSDAARLTRFAAEFARRVNAWNYPVFHETMGKNAEKHLRVICFCDAEKINPANNMLMWAHYADKHRGLRFTIRYPADVKLHRINYVPERIAISRELEPNHPDFAAALSKTLSTKWDAWRYEEEVRLLVDAKTAYSEKTPTSTKEFVHFKPEWIERIDIGTGADVHLVKMVTEIRRQKYRHAELNRAKIHASDYLLDYEPIPLT